MRLIGTQHDTAPSGPLISNAHVHIAKQDRTDNEFVSTETQTDPHNMKHIITLNLTDAGSIRHQILYS